MAERPVWIIKSKRSQSGRRHMAIFIPNLDCLNEDPNDKSKTCLGTKIHVTGAPMVGFCHEFQRNYSPTYDNTFDFAVKLASIDSTYVKDPPYATFSADQTALGKGLVDDLAFRVPAPAITKDYLNPANAQNIRDCQNWILDYIKYLVKRGYVNSTAVQIVEDNIDTHAGFALQPIT